MIDHTAPEPVWRQLADIIKGRVASGKYPSRTAVPSITQLAAEHGIAETTVRKALDYLKAGGVLTGVPGKGTYVA